MCTQESSFMHGLNLKFVDEAISLGATNAILNSFDEGNSIYAITYVDDENRFIAAYYPPLLNWIGLCKIPSILSLDPLEARLLSRARTVSIDLKHT